jgi:hypothetical protein
VSALWKLLGSPVGRLAATALWAWLLYRIGYDKGWDDGVKAMRKRWSDHTWETIDRTRAEREARRR